MRVQDPEVYDFAAALQFIQKDRYPTNLGFDLTKRLFEELIHNSAVHLLDDAQRLVREFNAERDLFYKTQKVNGVVSRALKTHGKQHRISVRINQPERAFGFYIEWVGVKYTKNRRTGEIISISYTVKKEGRKALIRSPKRTHSRGEGELVEDAEGTNRLNSRCRRYRRTYIRESFRLFPKEEVKLVFKYEKEFEKIRRALIELNDMQTICNRGFRSIRNLLIPDS